MDAKEYIPRAERKADIAQEPYAYNAAYGQQTASYAQAAQTQEQYSPYKEQTASAYAGSQTSAGTESQTAAYNSASSLAQAAQSYTSSQETQEPVSSYYSGVDSSSSISPASADNAQAYVSPDNTYTSQIQEHYKVKESEASTGQGYESKSQSLSGTSNDYPKQEPETTIQTYPLPQDPTINTVTTQFSTLPGESRTSREITVKRVEIRIFGERFVCHLCVTRVQRYMKR